MTPKTNLVALQSKQYKSVTTAIHCDSSSRKHSISNLTKKCNELYGPNHHFITYVHCVQLR